VADDTNVLEGAFVSDRGTAAITRLSECTALSVGADGSSLCSAFSVGGRMVGLQGAVTSLVASGTSAKDVVFVQNRGVTEDAGVWDGPPLRSPDPSPTPAPRPCGALGTLPRSLVLPGLTVMRSRRG